MYSMHGDWTGLACLGAQRNMLTCNPRSLGMAWFVSRATQVALQSDFVNALGLAIDFKMVADLGGLWRELRLAAPGDNGIVLSGQRSTIVRNTDLQVGDRRDHVAGDVDGVVDTISSSTTHHV
mmetsp:Transcript_17240/g.37718  ORF Transcript_17240/g.37718 Transcript_17240/m.37718 type:complete len:123 (+) Transcript_17240:355-723(+)